MKGEEKGAGRLARLARFHAALAHVVGEALSRGADEESYRRLLEWAVATVPGAQAGTLFVRSGDRFVLKAAVGHLEALVSSLGSVPAGVFLPEGSLQPGLVTDYYRRLVASSALPYPEPHPEPRPESRPESGSGSSSDSYPAAYPAPSSPADRRSSAVSVTLSAPLILEDEVVAVLNLDTLGAGELGAEDAFGAEALEVAESLGSLFALVLGRLERERELERRARHAALLARVGRELLEADEVEAALARLAELLLAELGRDTHRVGVYRLRKGGNFDCNLFGYSGGLAACVAAVMQRYDPLSDGDSLFGRVLESGAPYYAPDLATEPGWTSCDGFGAASLLALPLLPGGEVWGVLDVTSSRKDGFDEAGRALLESFGAAMERALAKQKERESLRAQLGKMEVVVAANEALRHATQPHEVYERTVEILLEKTSATHTSLFLCDSGGGELKVVATRGLYADEARGKSLPREESLVWRVLKAAQTQHVTGVQRPPESFGGGADAPSDFVGSPIFSRRGRAVGVLASSVDHATGFDASDISLAEAVAQACSGALTRLELLAQSGREAKAYRALANFGAIIEDINDVDVLMVLGLQQLQTQLGTDFATQFEVEGDELRLVKVWGQVPAGFREALEARPLQLGEGVAGQVVESGDLHYILSYQQDPRAVPELRRFGYETLLAVPVRHRDRVASVLTLYSMQQVKLDENRLTIARNFVRRLENALERADNLREVEATREGTLRALGLALEYRDIETKGHTDRVVGLSSRFGERLGLAPAQLESLRWGAYLHDIGKIAIPDAVLLKPGRLSSSEFETIKRHATIGYRTCRNIPFLPDETCALVRSHHERWTGGGYPDGLESENISLLARVFSLVDVYDALVSKRPYKEAWPREQAFGEILSLSGVHFDPELVPVFLEVAAESSAPG